MTKNFWASVSAGVAVVNLILAFCVAHFESAGLRSLSGRSAVFHSYGVQATLAVAGGCFVLAGLILVPWKRLMTLVIGTILLLSIACAHSTYDPYGDATRVITDRLSPQELEARGYARFERACYGVAPYQRCAWETETRANADAALKKQNAFIARYMEQQQEANPLNLLAASEAARTVQNDVGATTADRMKATGLLYDNAYRYARANGWSRAASRKFASEFTDGSR